jgi:hypothetical protein
MVGVAACGDDEEPEARLGPSGPISLRIVELSGSGSAPVAPGGASVLLGCDRLLSVRVDVENTFLLRPPGACAGAIQCGHVLLRVDARDDGEDRTARAAATLVSVDVSGLDLTPSHRFRVELRNDRGKPIAGEGGDVLFDEVEVRLDPASGCGASDAADAAVDAVDDGADANGDVTTDVVDDGADAGDAPPDATDAPPDSDAGADAPADASDS